MSEIFSKFTYDDTEYEVKDAAARTGLDNKVDKVAGKGLSTEDFTTAEKTKLAGIAAGAEVNVQSNWNEADSTSDAFIQNKPSIPAKTSDLQNDSGFITGVSWGAIGGTLADQTDLNDELTALNAGLSSANNAITALSESVAPIETGTATQPYAVGDYLLLNGQFCKVTAAIATGETITVGTNVAETSVGDEISSLNSNKTSLYTGILYFNSSTSAFPTSLPPFGDRGPYNSHCFAVRNMWDGSSYIVWYNAAAHGFQVGAVVSGNAPANGAPIVIGYPYIE